MRCIGGRGKENCATQIFEEGEGILDYKRKIIDMVKDIQNEKVLKLIFGFVKSGYEEEKAGS